MHEFKKYVQVRKDVGGGGGGREGLRIAVEAVAAIFND